MKNRDLLLRAANLLSDDGENPEYDRAISELVADVLGLTADDRDTVLTILRALSREAP